MLSKDLKKKIKNEFLMIEHYTKYSSLDIRLVFFAKKTGINAEEKPRVPVEGSQVVFMPRLIKSEKLVNGILTEELEYESIHNNGNIPEKDLKEFFDKYYFEEARENIGLLYKDFIFNEIEFIDKEIKNGTKSKYPLVKKIRRFLEECLQEKKDQGNETQQPDITWDSIFNEKENAARVKDKITGDIKFKEALDKSKGRNGSPRGIGAHLISIKDSLEKIGYTNHIPDNKFPNIFLNTFGLKISQTGLGRARSYTEYDVLIKHYTTSLK